MISIIFMLKILIALFLMSSIILYTLKNKYMVLYMTCIVFSVTTYEWITNQTLRISLQVVQLNMIDMLTIYLIVSTILLNYKTPKKYNYPKWIKVSLYLTFTIFLLSMCRGFFQNSFPYVIEDIRRLLEAFFIPLICYMYLPIEINDYKVKKILGVFSTIVVIYCAICWCLDLGLGIKVMPPQSDAGSTMRVLKQEQALIVAIIACYRIYSDLSGENRRYISLQGFLLILVVILLQHRSVWIAFITGIIYISIKCNLVSIKNIDHKSISISFLLQLIMFFICCPIFLFMFKDSHLLIQLQAGISGINAQDGSTLNYREQLWTAHLSGLSFLEWIIGKPFGSGYLVHLTNYVREITPHSAYIQTIIRCGILGVVAIVLFILVIMVKCIKYKKNWGAAVCLMLLVFWYPYSYNFYTAIALAFVVRDLRYEKYNKAKVMLKTNFKNVI